MTDLDELKGLGPVTRRWLSAIGVETRSDLARLGPVECYFQLKQLGFPVSLNLVYGIEGALSGVPWNQLPPPVRDRLRQEVAALEFPADTPTRPTFFTVDGHLDLAYNALKFNRDPWRPVREIRAREAEAPSPNGIATVSLPALLAGGVRLALGSIFLMPATSPFPFVYHEPTTYEGPEDAHRKGMAQLDYYHELADRGPAENSPAVRLVTDAVTLAEVVASHEGGSEPLMGIVPSMEGAAPIRAPEELDLWVERGVRAIGPAWDDTPYAAGAWRDQGGLTRAGHALLERMADHGLLLDITHLSERASLEALERYGGPVVASHCNARALVDSPRQLSDAQIRLLAERGGLMGTVLFNPFLRQGHVKGDAKEQVTLDHVTAHIDHVCQLLGSAAHVGIGSDLDGGFGAADIPMELDTAADLPLLTDALRGRGYGEDDLAAIMGGNWLRVLREVCR